MLATWEHLIYTTIVVSFIPVYVFRKSEYFFFFLICAFTDPIIIAVNYLTGIHTYFFFPFTSAVMVLALPVTNKKNILLPLFSAIILISFYKEHKWIPLIISSLNSFYVVCFFAETIYKEYKSTGSATLFMAVMCIAFTKEIVKVYFFYIHHDLFVAFYNVFLITGLGVPILVSILGKERKYFFPGFDIKEEQKNNPLGKIIPPSTVTAAEEENFLEQGNIFPIPQEIPLDKEIENNEAKKILNELKEREIEVLYYLSEGMDEKQITQRMYLGKKTIYKYVANLKEKLELGSTYALSHFAHINKEKLNKKFSQIKQKQQPNRKNSPFYPNEFTF